MHGKDKPRNSDFEDFHVIFCNKLAGFGHFMGRLSLS
jgi:hypothetical protein